MAETTKPVKRILLKLSGESLMGNKEHGIDSSVLESYATEITSIAENGLQIGIVVGGGNICRGKQAEGSGIDRVQGDYMGMLATMINGLALQSAIEAKGPKTRLLSAIKMEQIAEPFIRRRAIRHLEKGRIVIFGMGTGNPYFTTDTAAAMRAIEIEADLVLKGTRVEGVFTADPEKEDNARLYKHVGCEEVYDKGLNIMDLTAFTLCRENKMPVRVFCMDKPGNLPLATNLHATGIGTLIDPHYSGKPVMQTRNNDFRVVSAKKLVRHSQDEPRTLRPVVKTD